LIKTLLLFDTSFLKKRKKSRFLKSGKNVNYVFSSLDVASNEHAASHDQFTALRGTIPGQQNTIETEFSQAFDVD